MKNPEYYRLMKKGGFVGFKRIVTEYLPAAATKWQLDPVEHDSEATVKLSKPAVGIATLGRQKIVTVEQKKVKADEDIPPIINQGSEKLKISAVDEYMISDRRIIEVIMRAAETDGPCRRR